LKYIIKLYEPLTLEQRKMLEPLCTIIEESSSNKVITIFLKEPQDDFKLSFAKSIYKCRIWLLQKEESTTCLVPWMRETVELLEELNGPEVELKEDIRIR